MAGPFPNKTRAYRQSSLSGMPFQMGHADFCDGSCGEAREWNCNINKVAFVVSLPKCQFNIAINGFLSKFIRRETKLMLKAAGLIGGQLENWQKWQIKGSKCLLCSKKLTAGRYGTMRHHEEWDTACLLEGAEVVVRACSPKCQRQAIIKFEKEIKCYQQQKKEIQQVVRVASTMKKALNQMHRDACKSQKKESAQHRISPT